MFLKIEDMPICVCSECVLSYYDIYRQLRHDPQQQLYLAQNLHIIWYGYFVENFQQISNVTSKAWSLMPCTETGSSIMTINESAKVRFICQNCGNVWTTMYGVAVFSVYESNGYTLSFKLLGQKCNKCCSEDFQMPIWYVEEVERVLDNVSKIILNTGISFKNIKSGHPKGCHKEDSCEACQEKVCQYSRSKYNSECQEEIETEEEKHVERLPLTSDYESENELSSSLENSIFKRSISMPAKPVENALYPVFYCET